MGVVYFHPSIRDSSIRCKLAISSCPQFFHFRCSSDSILVKIQFHNFPHFPFLSGDIVFGNQNPQSLTIMMPFLVSVQSVTTTNTFGVERQLEISVTNLHSSGRLSVNQRTWCRSKYGTVSVPQDPLSVTFQKRPQGFYDNASTSKTLMDLNIHHMSSFRNSFPLIRWKESSFSIGSNAFLSVS
ncbi:hypothetical protein T4A_5986 [Trichinella pseudospiralis]|uniref:Uncharacterized protein n=1 Tax=Trichinella pseudospiralis TaxID=6337 RepID=A0A0V0YID6_TRIPS|nr:hypothetical protein T4E_5492 [Trichinella pseudospiralis]KRY77433.1 hypothetical protein T4A_5986 [Trichinella pseudospiralis]KRZ44772.1 hypothetical protein T4C_4507 [Trichinella pseudospiralis]